MKKFFLSFIPVILFVGSLKAQDCRFYPVKKKKPLIYGMFLIDRFEYNLTGKEKKSIDYELTGWYGGDYRRLWIELEGKHNTKSRSGEIEKLDFLYGKLISAFWDVRAGAGYIGSYGEDSKSRAMLVLGLKGLAPYFFEIDTNLRITDKGEIYGDFEAEYDLLFTQRLILQPRIDTTFSFNKIEELGIGSGINNIKLSLRLRYEFRREFAPYVGVSFKKLIGQTKQLASLEGKSEKDFNFFIGLRMWF